MKCGRALLLNNLSKISELNVGEAAKLSYLCKCTTYMGTSKLQNYEHSKHTVQHFGHMLYDSSVSRGCFCEFQVGKSAFLLL